MAENFQNEYQNRIKGTKKEVEKSNEVLINKKIDVYTKTIKMLDEKLKILTNAKFQDSADFKEAKKMVENIKHNFDSNRDTVTVEDLYSVENAIEALFLAHKMESSYYDEMKKELDASKESYKQSEKENNQLKITLHQMTEENDRISKTVKSSLQEMDPEPCPKCRQPRILLCSSSCEIKSLIQPIVAE